MFFILLVAKFHNDRTWLVIFFLPPQAVRPLDRSVADFFFSHILFFFQKVLDQIFCLCSRFFLFFRNVIEDKVVSSIVAFQFYSAFSLRGDSLSKLVDIFCKLG